MTDTVAGGTLRTPARGVAARQQPATARRTIVWSAEDLLRWAITVGLGGIAVAVSWYVCAGEATFSQQIGPADAAVAGLLLAGIGNAAWLLKGRRAIGERRRLLLPDVTADPGVRRVVPVPVRADDLLPNAADPTALLVAGEGMERFHRPGCALTRGRSGFVEMTRHEHERAGRRPCGVCRP
jgi:hypothetical protein